MPSEFVRDLRLCHPPHGFEQTTAHVNAKWLMSVADHLEKTESKLQAAEGALANIIIKDPDRTLVVADDKGTVLPLRVWALKGSPSHDAVANVIGEMRSVAALIKVRGQGSVGAMGIERWATELAAAVGEVKP